MRIVLILRSRPEATLQDILDTMHDSEFFPRTGKDTPSQFWSAYERLAKQHDNEFLERKIVIWMSSLYSCVLRPTLCAQHNGS